MTTIPRDIEANPSLSRWISFDEAGIVTVRTGKVELGQGILTALTMLASHELGVQLSQVRIVRADTVTAPDEGYTAGSQSIQQGGAAIRWACALTRQLFAKAARDRLASAPGNEPLIVQDGVFRSAAGTAEASYWDLVQAVDIDVQITDFPPPSLSSTLPDFGDVRRLDLDVKTGSGGFIQDMQIDGMAYGGVLRATHPRERLVSFDRERLAGMDGVLCTVQDGHFGGVVAASLSQLSRAMEAAYRSARWERASELPDAGDANEWMHGWPTEPTVRRAENVAVAPAGSVTKWLTARYSRPYIAHASVGPSCGVARWTDGRLEIWTHSQGIYPLQRQVARALNMAEADIAVRHVDGAGCYGHNGADDAAFDSVLLSRSAGTPVMCLWTRREELCWSPFGAPMIVEMSAELDSENRVVDWNHNIRSTPHAFRPGAGSGINLLASWDLAEPATPSPPIDVPQPQGGADRNATTLYDFGARRVTKHLLAQGPLRSSSMRTLGAHCNVFAAECFVDELAELCGEDPVSFRLRHMSDPRAAAVIRAAASLSGWDPRAPAGTGLGRGIGFARYKNSAAYFSVVAEVEVSQEIRVHRLYAAVDAGQVVHRDGFLNQLEGGMIQAASWTLKEAAGWNRDGFGQQSWQDYPTLRFSETPEIKIEILDSAHHPPLGVGECAAGPLAAAIGNALHHALGSRVRDMPLTRDRISKTLLTDSQPVN